MKVLNINYKNYRCFLDAEVKFNTTSSKNIALMVGPNGGGKTEMLFSFWWVLYGFDFSRLHGKEQTPYSLNSTLYQKLENDKAAKPQSCSVEFSFEIDGDIYTMYREEVFSRQNGKIVSQQNVELSTTTKTGKSLPCRDIDEAERRLSRVIPVNVLHGIVFDGERMKQLSSVSDSSKIAVEGVIKEITNEELYSIVSTELDEIKKELSNAYKKLGARRNNSGLELLNSRIQKLENEIKNDETGLAISKENLAEVEEELADVILKMKDLEEVKRFEKEREKLNRELNKANNELKDAIDTFSKDLAGGYLLLSKKLNKEVQDNLDEIDIPAGLTVEAVESILKRKNCLCGCLLNDDIKNTLTSLLSSLPPDNINSTISEMARQMGLALEEEKEKEKRSYKKVLELEKAIIDLKEKIALISVQITSSESESAVELEERYQELISLVAKYNAEINLIESRLETNAKMLETLKKQRDNEIKTEATGVELTKKSDFVDKCTKAIKAIGEYNKQKSLEEINKIINDAYENLSEDAVRGRKLHIVSFNKKKKYQMITYFESKFKRLKIDWINSGEIAARIGTPSEAIDEEMMLKIAESNSTGQSKVNSLAFVKAILDFSSKARNDEDMYISKSYPLLIDSPFTELSEDNQTLTAKNIHKFGDQIILLASEQSLLGVKDLIEPYVGCTAQFIKDEKENYSTIKQ